MVTVFVQGLQFYAFHGVPDAEREIGHRYQLDIWMTVDAAATSTDAVADTVDYGAVAIRAQEIGSRSQYRTVERLAQVIGEDLLAVFPAIEAVRLRLSKPFPPAPVIASAAGVEITITR